MKDIIGRPVTDPEDSLKVTAACVKLGINVKIDFIIGHPTETVADLQETHQIMRQLMELGGEVFVRKLGVVPNSRYQGMLANGWQLPVEDSNWLSWEAKILALKRDDSRYRELVMADQVPNKFLIDRKLGIIYPHQVFDIETLRQHQARLSASAINDQAKSLFAQMFELMIEIKETD